MLASCGSLKAVALVLNQRRRNGVGFEINTYQYVTPVGVLPGIVYTSRSF
jgi:hypothetical protein